MGLDGYLEPPEPMPTKDDIELTKCDCCDSYECHADADYDLWAGK